MYSNTSGTLTSVCLIYSLYCSLYIYQGAERENLFNSQGLHWLVIIFFILMTLMCNAGVIL